MEYPLFPWVFQSSPSITKQPRSNAYKCSWQMNGKRAWKKLSATWSTSFHTWVAQEYASPRQKVAEKGITKSDTQNHLSGGKQLSLDRIWARLQKMFIFYLGNKIQGQDSSDEVIWTCCVRSCSGGKKPSTKCFHKCCWVPSSSANLNLIYILEGRLNSFKNLD